MKSLAALVAALLLAQGGSPVEQTSPGVKPALRVLESFDGLGFGFAEGPGSNHPPAPRNPSDNTLAVGPEHIVQIVNSQVAVFTKKGARFDSTGKTLYGPTSTNTFFAGFGGACESRPNGDAVVRYDQLADRWLIVMPIFRRVVFDADRSKPGEPAKPGDTARPGPAARPGPPPPLPPAPQAGQRGGQSVPARPEAAAGVPARPEPVEAPAEGTYAMCYAVSTTSDPLGPYYRYAFERPLFPDYPRPAVWPDGYYVPTSTGDDVIQKHACVAERGRMLEGGPAREQCVIIDGVNFLNNADVDGRALPPAGAPNIMIAAGGTQLKDVLADDRLDVWQFHVDWKTPSNTRVSGPARLAVAPYRYLCGGQLTTCVPQPNTERRLDAQGDKIMQRLVPDRFYRWMASPAMDRKGDIGIGYSFGGAPNFAGQRFAARLAGDPPGLLTFHETVLVEGEAAQNVMRWEDYTQTAMDPSDDCTIWYVGDYVKKDAPTYSTRIGSFRLPGC